MNPTLFFVFVFAALTVYTLAKIVSPFLEDRREQLRFELLDEEVQQIERLVARKSVLMQSLRDIEFDHETGKLSDQDYERLKKKYEHRAVRVMRDLDELRGDANRDEEIDSALERRLQERAERVPKPSTDDHNVESAEIECPECGKGLEPEARFCSRCGTPLEYSTEPDTTTDPPDDAADGDEPAAEGLETASDRNDRTVSDLRSEATG
jgi:hypothetical protein